MACNEQHWRLRFKTVDKMCLLLTESIDCNWMNHWKLWLQLNEWMIDQGVRSRWFMDQMSNLDWICLNICHFGTFKYLFWVLCTCPSQIGIMVVQLPPESEVCAKKQILQRKTKGDRKLESSVGKKCNQLLTWDKWTKGPMD